MPAVSVVANVAVNLDAKNAIQNAQKLSNAVGGIQPAANKAAVATKGFGAALQSALGPLLAVSTALAAIKKGLDTTFTRAAAEQKLKNFTSGTIEYNAALAVAAQSASKFGLSQTEATSALADTYVRLKGLGFGLKETSQIYDGFNAIALESGTSAADASGAFLQLSQALGSGRLQGDELRSILERMPTLAQRIATSMGRSAGEIKTLGSEGKLTSEVIAKALAEAAEGSENFSDKLTRQQQAQKDVAATADRLLKSIGDAFSPVVTGAAEAFVYVGQEIAKWWEYLGNVLFPQVVDALKPLISALQEAFSDVDLKAFQRVFQEAVIKGFEIFIIVVGKVSEVLGFVIRKLKEMSQNPVFQFIAEQVGRLVEMLGLSGDRVEEFHQEQKKVTEEAAKTVDQFSSMPEPIKDAKEEAKKLRKAQERVTTEIRKQTSAIERQYSRATDLADSANDLAQERLNTEKKLNEILQDEVQHRMENAKTDEERIKYAVELFRLQKQAADLEYRSAIAGIKNQLRKVELAYEEVVAKEKAVRTEVERAKAAGTLNDSHLETLNLVREEVEFSAQRLKVAKEISTEQERQALLIKESANEAARLALQQNLAKKATMETNAAMQQSQQAIGATTTGTVQTRMPIDPDIQERVTRTGKFRHPAELVNELEERQERRNSREIQLERLSRSRAMERYNVTGGSQGSASINPTVNVTTGPVMNMDGQNYVNQNDFVAGLQSASTRGAEMAMQMITSSGGARRRLGVG